MGLSFRKTKRIGLLNLNFSKSGLGFSVGPRGAKISVGPRGTNLNLGYKGLRFQQRLDSGHKSKNGLAPDVTNQQNPIRSIGNETDRIPDFCRQIEEKLQRRSYLVPALIVSVIVCIVLPSIYAILLGVVICCVTYYFDGLRKRVLLDTISKSDRNLDELFKKIDSVVSNALIDANSAQSIWGVSDVIFTSDWKRNAGATSLINRIAFKFKKFNHRFLKISPQPMSASWGKSSIIFIPTGVMLITGNKIRYVDYKHLQLQPGVTRFREGGYVPRDSLKVGETWQYVRKDGGPDRRFAQNRKIPILEYGELRLHADGVFETKMMFSRSDIPFMLKDVLGTIGSIVSVKRQENQI